eukprot:3775147-Lingulodinium_polyedra.AAC.1
MTARRGKSNGEGKGSRSGKGKRKPTGKSRGRGRNFESQRKGRANVYEKGARNDPQVDATR